MDENADEENFEEIFEDAEIFIPLAGRSL